MSRVLLVGKGAPDRGGIPSFLQQVREGPVGRRHDVTFLNVAHAGTPEGGRLTAGNVARTLRDTAAVFRQAKGHDVVHVNSAVTPATTVVRAGMLAAAGRVRGAAVVVHVHGGNASEWLALRRNRVLMRLAMAPAQRVVAVWASGYRVLSPLLGRRARMVANGIDTERFAPVPRERKRETPHVLYVGLLTPRKGVLDLLSASRALRDDGVGHELHLVGGTPDEGPDAAAPVLAAAEGRAVLHGTRPPEEMPAAYADADVFCLPSWWEAMPMSVLEAMAAGLPVVATDVGDVARLVEHGVTGLVVPAKDPDALAAALRALLVDPQLRRSMGAAARRRVEEQFSAQICAEALCEVYAEALGSR